MEAAAPKRYEPKFVEEQVAKIWEENKIVQKVLESNSEGPLFSFLEGPPTVNGYMHIGHTRGRVYKDIVLRYKTMKGYRVWRRAGWDCQGLPTEIEVEKRLGITSKRDIEKIGMEKFVQEAWNVVDHYISHWRRASERLGLWLDYENAYETRKDEYMEHVWHLLKRAYESGDLVESMRVVPTCPQCETALSQHELAQGYDETVDPSIYVKFPLANGRYIIIWTTTPWTLPGNEAVAVKQDAKYVEIDVNGERWFVAEQLLPRFVEETKITGFKVLATYGGEYFVGMEYRHPLCEEVPAHGKERHFVVASEHVTLEEGTGFVHIAPAHGPEDFEIGQRHSLPIFCPVNQSGFFTSDGGKYAGLKVWLASERIVEDLEKKGLLVKKLEILHNYPHCWRCGNKLIYLSSIQWFLKVNRIKEKMIQENRSVKWWPEWAGSNRFGDWLVNAQDWCISRSKVWGTPLNVWRCESCGEKVVIGSKNELENALEKPTVKRMHRPWIDAYIFRCNSCGGMMKRIPFVLDTWLDSGVAFYASVDALRKQELFNEVYPYDFITEAIDQTRGWFYTLLFTSTLLLGKSPFKSVLNQGHVLDEFGKKMSKSRGNVVWAEEAFDRFGVDPLRIYLVSKAEPWSTINFVPSEVSEVAEDLNILWNVFQFASTYQRLDNFDPSKHRLEDFGSFLRPEDRWILAKVNQLVADVSAHLENMEIHRAVKEILSFIVDDLSRTYLRTVRRIAWSEAENPEKYAVYSCLNYVLERILLVLAPFAPYFSDYFYRSIRGPDGKPSIHLEKWPTVDEAFHNPQLVAQMNLVKEVLTTVLAARQKAGRKLRSPVAHTKIIPKSYESFEALKAFSSFLKESVNTEALEIQHPGSEFEETQWVVEADLSKAGPLLGKHLPQLLSYLKNSDGKTLKLELETKNGLTVSFADGEKFLPASMFFVKRKIPDNYSFAENPHAEVYIDLRKSEELEAMSWAKEIIRRIQVMRKEQNLDITEKILCIVQSDDQSLIRNLDTKREYIESETRAMLVLSNLKEQVPIGFFVRSWDVEGVAVVIGIGRTTNNLYNVPQ